MARLASQETPGIHLFLGPQQRYRHVAKPSFYVGARDVNSGQAYVADFWTMKASPHTHP